jgi:hypothetical protein
LGGGARVAEVTIGEEVRLYHENESRGLVMPPARISVTPERARQPAPPPVRMPASLASLRCCLGHFRRPLPASRLGQFNGF